MQTRKTPGVWALPFHNSFAGVKITYELILEEVALTADSWALISKETAVYMTIAKAKTKRGEYTHF